MTSDVRYLPADQPLGEWRLVLPRQTETEYSVEDRGDHFYITIRRANGFIYCQDLGGLGRAWSCCYQRWPGQSWAGLCLGTYSAADTSVVDSVMFA